MVAGEKITYWYLSFASWLLKLNLSSAMCCAALTWFSSYSRIFSTPTSSLNFLYIRSTMSLILFSSFLISVALFSTVSFNWKQYQRSNIFNCCLGEDRYTHGHDWKFTLRSSGFIRSISSLITRFSFFMFASLSSILFCNKISRSENRVDSVEAQKGLQRGNTFEW